LRQATEQSVLDEVKKTLLFARDYFAMRGRVILATHIQTQVGFFESAQVFDQIEEQALVPSADAN
jgi:hypothetical protein